MRKEPRNNWFWIDIEMQRDGILQDIFDAADVCCRCSHDVIFRARVIVFQRKNQSWQVGQVPVVANKREVNGVYSTPCELVMKRGYNSFVVRHTLVLA